MVCEPLLATSLNLGEGDPHLLPRVISRHRAGKLKIVGTAKTWSISLIWTMWFMPIFVLFARWFPGMTLGGNAYFIGQNEPVALWKWLNEIFLELGLPILEKSVSFRTAYRIGSVIERIWNLFHLTNDPPMTRFVASQLAHDHWFCTSAAERILVTNQLSIWPKQCKRPCHG